MTLSHALAFVGAGAAGWDSPLNPQFFLALACPCSKIAISVAAPHADALCFYLQRRDVHQQHDCVGAISVDGNPRRTTAGDANDDPQTARRRRIFDFENGSNRAHTSALVAGPLVAEIVEGPVAAGDYVLLVMTRRAGIESTVTTTVTLTTTTAASSSSSSWLSGATCGDATKSLTLHFNATNGDYGNAVNPQFFIDVTAPVATLFLHMLCAHDVEAVRFFVQRRPRAAQTTDNRHRRLAAFPDDTRVATSEYCVGNAVGCVVANVADGERLVVLVMTNSKRSAVAADYSVALTVESDSGGDSFGLSGREAAATLNACLPLTGAPYGSHHNPRFLLTLTRATDLVVSFDAAGADAVRFFLQRRFDGHCADVATAVAVDFPDAPHSRVFTSEYVVANRVTGAVANVAAGCYVLLVMTRSPCRGGIATVTVTCDDDSDAQLSPHVVVHGNVGGCAPSGFAHILASHRHTASPVHVRGAAACGHFFETVAVARAAVDEVNKAASAAAPATSCGAGRHFVDLDFPHTEASINGHTTTENEADDESPQQRGRARIADGDCVWRRLHEFAECPRLFATSAETAIDAAANDARQSTNGFANCWIVAVCLSLCARSGGSADAGASAAPSLRRLIYPSRYNPVGIYAVSLCVHGRWRALLVDDYLPSTRTTTTTIEHDDDDGSDSPRFGHCGSRRVFWFALLEKAFAKVLGCYASLIGSNARSFGVLDLMEMLTGGSAAKLDPAHRHDRHHHLMSPGPRHTMIVSHASDSSLFWFAALRRALERRWIVTTATRRMSDGLIDRATGLVNEHAYSVVGTHEADGVNLLRLRHTWGHAGSSNTEASASSAIGDTSDGHFWVEHQCFIAHFTAFNICTFVGDDDDFESPPSLSPSRLLVQIEECAALDAKCGAQPRNAQILLELCRADSDA